MHNPGSMDSAPGEAGKKQKTPPMPLEDLKTLSPEQINLLHGLGVTYVQEVVSMLADEETRKYLLKYLHMSRRKADELEKEADFLLTPEESKSLRKKTPPYPLGAEDYRKSEIEKKRHGEDQLDF